LKTSSRSHLLALLSRSATWSLWPSNSSEPERDLDLERDLLLGLRELLLGVRDLLLGLRDLLLGERDLFLSRDLDLDLLDLGLPVLDLVLALQSGDPDFDLVFALPLPPAELGLIGDLTGDLTGLGEAMV